MSDQDPTQPQQPDAGGAPEPQTPPQAPPPPTGAPQYGAPQSGAPQYGAPQYGAPPTGPGYGQPQYGAPAGQMSPADERTWSGLAHFSGLIGLVIGLSFLGPLAVMLIKGNESPKVRANAVEALNMQISYLIYLLIASVAILLLIGILLLPVVGAMWLIFTIIGGIKGMGGEDYRYPLIFRFVN